MGSPDLQSTEDITRILGETKTIAVLGIKTDAQAGEPAFYVPSYAKAAGFTIIPVPVYYPDVTEILGTTVYRSLAAIPVPVDMVSVFRRSRDIRAHLDDIVATMPRVVWLQSGIRNEEVARILREKGIGVVQDRCLMVELQRRGR